MTTPSSFTAIGLQLSTTPTIIVNSPQPSGQNIIHRLTFFNTSATLQETVKLYKYTTGETPVDANLLVERIVLPRQTWDATFAVNKVLLNTQEIAGTTTTASTVNVDCSGVVV